MTRVVAGIDVGNSTTEILLADTSAEPPRPLAWDRSPTRGRKGTPAAARAAAELAVRTARRAGLRVDAAALAPQHAVDTTTDVVTRPPADLAPLVLIAAGARTPGRPGAGCGRPVPVTADPPSGDPVVLVVPPDVSFRSAAQRISELLDGDPDGRVRLEGIVLGSDEGVLLAHRVPGLPNGVPVLDEVDTRAALACERLVVEVAAPHTVLRAAADPLHVVAALGLDETGRVAAQRLSTTIRDARAVVIGVGSTDRSGPATGSAAASSSEPASPELDAASASSDPLWQWTVDLDRVLDDVEARRGPEPLGVVMARLDPAPADQAAGVTTAVGDVLGVDVIPVPSEAAAARTGALSTPGARQSGAVLDLGGGTLDLVPPDDADPVEVSAAGGGELVSVAVAQLVGCARGAAEWVKRGPSARLDGPHVLVGEDGERRFAERPAPPDAVGSLVVPGPAGLLPFSRALAPAEWRALRLHAKRRALGDNVARLVDRLTERLGSDPLAGRDLVLVGGVAGDEELLRILDSRLDGAIIGRADVAASVAGSGCLGHRWAVAYGLTVLAVR